MGFYFRKSFGKGAFRINLSKSGVSYSIGVKGARVRFSNKGTYVSFRSNGISYQQKISERPRSSYQERLDTYRPSSEQHTITSGDVEQITDVDSQNFIDELKEKAKKISYHSYFGIYPMICSIILLLCSFGSGNTVLGFFSFALIIFFRILLPHLKKEDERRLLVEIYYDMDERIQEVYRQFNSNFSCLLNSSKTWQYLHAQNTNDYKYTGGASVTVTRKPLTHISASKSPSKVFRTNVDIPYLGLINTELYFFPERLIIKRGQEFGAIMYKNIDCYSAVTRFIESEALPQDAHVVGHTWRYLNKNGTPDRRFNNNCQLPVCQYSEYSFRSASGLNEKISTSKVGALDDFVRLIKGIGQLQGKMVKTLHFTSSPSPPATFPPAL